MSTAVEFSGVGGNAVKSGALQLQNHMMTTARNCANSWETTLHATHPMCYAWYPDSDRETGELTALVTPLVASWHRLSSNHRHWLRCRCQIIATVGGNPVGSPGRPPLPCYAAPRCWPHFREAQRNYLNRRVAAQRAASPVRPLPQASRPLSCIFLRRLSGLMSVHTSLM
jgi:hypothetical protein